MRRYRAAVGVGGLAAAALTLIIGSAPQAAGQVNDLSGSGGRIGTRIDDAVQRAASLEAGSRFYAIFRFEGLVPSDAEAGGGGTLFINRYGGWTMSGFSGLAPHRDMWDQLESGERLLDLATMQMTDPGPQPVLEPRPMLAVITGRVAAGRGAKIADISLRFPSGTIRLRQRQVYWLGEASGSDLVAWIRSELGSLDVSTDGSVRRDLVGLLSVQPRGGDIPAFLEEIAAGDPDGNARRAAITYLGRRPEDTSGNLTTIFSRAEDPEDRARALEALADRVGPESSDRLIAAARDTDESEEVRAVAISFLGRIGGRSVDSVLEELLSSPDRRIRDLTVEAWEDRDPARAVPLLERVTATDEDGEIREQAVASLGDIDDPRATDALERIFDSSTAEPVRRRAMRELVERKNGDGEMVSWLAGIARTDSSIGIRKEAVRQLGRTNDPAAIRVLEQILRIGRL